MTLDALLEAALFVTGAPMASRRLADISNTTLEEVEEALQRLAARLQQGSGLQLTRHGEAVQLVTHPEAAEVVRNITKLETESELSRAALETLAILAYRGPLTRPEIEQLRGVQSAIMLRNLRLRGLVEMKEETRLGQPVYHVTLDFLNHLGLRHLEDLPDFASLHAHPTVEQVLDELSNSS